MEALNLILTINPGSTSTKIGLYKNQDKVFHDSVSHDAKKLSTYKKIIDQYEFRKDEVLKNLENHEIDLKSLSIIMGRGGILRPLQSGVYEVNDNMIQDLTLSPFEEHASNLGALIAKEIADLAGCKAYIADPVVVDEMDDIARITGLPDVKKGSKFHALNQKAVARRASIDLNRKYEELNLIIAHLGGGISVAAHRKGRAIDLNDALYGDGPFSPERTGKLPTGAVIQMCFSKGASEDEIKKRLVGSGGLVAHCGTNDAREIEERILRGDQDTLLVYQAMAYQISKEIGALAVSLKGQVDAILITGGIARSKMLTDWIKDWTEFLAPVHIYPGEDELHALGEAGLRILRGEEKALEY
jgi:butyrate kinase